MAENFEGGCACGNVRYRLTSAPMFVNCCHRRDCQRQTGSAFVINAVIETDRIALLSGEPEPVAVPTESGRPHDIYRCGVCHTAVWSDYGRRPPLRFCPRRHARQSRRFAPRRAHLHAVETALGRLAEVRPCIRDLLRHGDAVACG